MEIKGNMEIVPPKGMRIDPEALKENRVEFINIDSIDELPESWKGLNVVSGYHIDDGRVSFSKITGNSTSNIYNKDILPTKELAEAILALCQLLQLRDRYNDGWEPNWEDDSLKHVIYVYENKPRNRGNIQASKRGEVLAFKSEKLKDRFFNAPEIYKLIEIAKPLL